MIFLMAVDAPLDGIVRYIASTHMVIVNGLDLAASGADRFPVATFTTQTVTAHEPGSITFECESGRVDLAAFASKQGDGGE